MKQKSYSEVQKVVIDILNRLSVLHFTAAGNKIIEEIREKYNIEEPYLTIREYIKKHDFEHNPFHFKINNKEIIINSLEDMLTDELCFYYPLTKEYYVVEAEFINNDYYLLKVEPKED